MRIKHLKVSNFKSFNDIDVELGPFTVVVGANASGKSNFVEIFRFLRDIAQDGLRNAVSMQGDVPFLKSVTSEPDRELVVSLAVEYERPVPIRPWRLTRRQASIHLREDHSLHEIHYTFALGFQDAAPGYSRSQEKAVFHLKLAPQSSMKKPLKMKSWDVEIIANRVGSKISLESRQPDDLPPEINKEFRDTFEIYRRLSDSQLFRVPDEMPPLLLETDFTYGLLPVGFRNDFREIGIYDFDPKMAKKAVQITGKSELEGDGNNLALVLSRLLDSEKDRRRFTNLLSDLLPFVNEIGVERIVDKSLLFTVRESYAPNIDMPASLISDGTINITAVLLALYFQSKSIVIIEEPERNIHPHLMSRLMSHLKEASESRQIIVTTHNPELVKHAAIDDLLFIARERDGFSHVSRPASMEMVVQFLKDDIGVEDLFVQNLLGV